MKRPRAIFKTMQGRVSFTLILTIFLFAAAIGYGASMLPEPRELVMLIGKLDSTSLAYFGIALFAAALLSKLAGDFLIAGKVRRLARAAKKVAAGEADSSALPTGLGELDELTEDFAKVANELSETKATVDQQVRLRTSVLEVSKGMSELDKARTDALLESIGEGVVAIDQEGKITFMNAVARKALWWEESSAMGAPITAAFRLEDEKERTLESDTWPTSEVLKTGKKVVSPAPVKPLYVRGNDRERFPVKMTASPLSVDGKPAGALVTFDDITLAVEFDKRKSEFISIAAHQLRSPATAIKLMTDMMRKGELGSVSEKQADWMGKLFISADVMLDLVNELLNISRLEAGETMKLEARDLAELAEETARMSEPLLLMKKQRLVMKKVGAPKARFDKFMIAEVMKNFVSNAHKYSPEGTPIEITVNSNEGKARFAVKDSGMGIPKEDHEKMFGKFFRAENATDSGVVGTGLGLYYCKTVIEKHGGEIGFDSEVGKGSTFWFTIPMQ